jgi:hypothetical protein
MFDTPWKSKLTFQEEKRLNKGINYRRKETNPETETPVQNQQGLVRKTNFGAIKVKAAMAPPIESVAKSSNVGIPQFLLEKEEADKNERSFNSIEKELMELEYLNLLKDRDRVAFHKFLNQKKYVSDNNHWYQQQMFQDHLTKTHIQNLHDLYDPVHTHPYTPEINPKSRWLTEDYVNEFKVPLNKSKSANKMVSMRDYQEKKNEKPKKKFNQAEFNNHLIKINAWNKDNNTTLLKNFVRNFNRRPDLSETKKLNSKSVTLIQNDKTRPPTISEAAKNFNIVADYFEKDVRNNNLPSRVTTPYKLTHIDDRPKSQKITFY